MDTATPQSATSDPELLNHLLIPKPDSHQKLRHIFASLKEEVETHMAENSEPPNKRGRKLKGKNK